MSVAPDTVLYKDPNDELVYVFDWTDWLGAASIVTNVFTISGPDSVLTKDNETIVSGNKKTSLRLLAGTARKRYRVTGKITTDETPAQEKERSFYLQMRDE